MDNAQLKLLYYVLKRIVGRIIPAAYFLGVTGVFSSGITRESFRFSIWLIIGWLAVTFIQDYAKHVMSEDTLRPKPRAVAIGFKSLIPWIIVFVIATAINIGFADMYRHLVVFVICGSIASIFEGLEEYYRLLIKKGANTT